LSHQQVCSGGIIFWRALYTPPTYGAPGCDGYRFGTRLLLFFIILYYAERQHKIKIGLAVLVQYRRVIDSHVAVASTALTTSRR